MKNKKLLSIILASIMLLSAIPSLSVGANPAVSTLMDYKNYRTVVTSETVALDGELDEIYKNSQKISAGSWIVGNSSKVDFEAYTALTLRGLYVWAEIKDGSLDKSDATSVSESDRFQIYIKFYDGTDLAWGWYETDYNGKVSEHSVMSAKDIEDGDYPISSGCSYGNVALKEAQVSTVKLADGSGWRSEIFIPLPVELLNFTNYDLSIGLQAQNGAYGSSDYGVCYDRTDVQNAWCGYDCYKSIALVRYIDRSPSYAPNYVFTMNDIYAMDDVPVQGDLVNNAVYAPGNSFSLDGKKDAFYSEHAKIPMVVWHTYYSNSKPVATPIAKVGDVYVAFDDNNLYIYYEKYDASFGSNEKIAVSYLFDDGSTVTAGRYNIKLSGGSAIEHQGSGAYGWPGTKSSSISHKVASLGNSLYSAEFKIPLPSGVKTKLESDGSFKMNLGFDTAEYKSSTRQYMAGSTPDILSYYDYNSCKGKYPTLILSKSFTDENPGEIHGASLALGSDITINYYATVGSADVGNAYMRFTRGDKEYVAYPRKIKNSSEYMFSYKEIAPQAIGDNIKAELVVDGKTVATYDEYSVRQNCINLLSNPEYNNDVKTVNLIKSLLNYGAAAQKYANYNTDLLANKGYEVILNSPEKSDNVRSVSPCISDTLKMTAVGVYFGSTNKIYVKFTAESLKGVTVKMNGVAASIEESDADSNEYIAYSDSICASHFGLPYSIELSCGSAVQTATYSVNSYAYKMIDSSNKSMAELAKATYTYGDAAKKCASLGDSVYTVLSYNDADNHSPYTDNHYNAMQIIKDCDPDLVGMQEIQKEHVESCYLSTNFKDEGGGCFSGENGVYAGIFYHSTPGAPDRSDYPDNSTGNAQYKQKYNCYSAELQHVSGDMILYRKDKFEIVKDASGKEVKGRLWLSDTPDTPSILPNTEYTQCVMYVLLRDKQTGNEILYINLHASYLEANQEQIEILMELFEKENSYVSHAGLDMTSYRKIYTADWNFGRTSAGYGVMNANGYSTTESLIQNCYKPATTVSGSFIDFCFVDGNEFIPLKYKVINDHPLSLVTSDHYPVYSKIAWVEDYESVPLQPLY